MRVLVTSFPWEPHFNPIVPLGWAAVLAGHEVRVATTPTMTEVVGRSGLPVVSVGGDPSDAFREAGVEFTPPKGDQPDAAAQARWPEDWPAHPESLSDGQRDYFRKIGLFASVIAAAQLPDLIALGESWRPDLIVHDGTQFAGPVLASALGVPNARYLLGYPGQLRVDTCYGPELVPEYRALYEKFGVTPRQEPTVWLDPCPPSMQYPSLSGPSVLRMRYVPYNGTAELPAWLHEPPQRPRVYLTWGKTTGEWEGAAIGNFVRQAIEAAAGLDVELVAALSPTLLGLLTDLPEGVRTVTGLPMAAVLRTCTAVIHHAGPGTTLTAAAAGLPQLMITNHPHNAAIAAQVARIGAGRHLPIGELPSDQAATSAEVAALLEKPAFAQDAARLRQEIEDQPSPSSVVDRLAELC
ncbi:glycosyltransferase [Amycolatopsis xylanica]|uniref:Glycosyltransferase n=1 Tax=Amycolatopsis xylanica TaxID=589385 RepID=A0A1H2VSE0_9PSEU|nr:nucleotide disphospho-sugar-binding domain-containing protein [Amycolatopsis xylanica]SDW71147.1 glycosyltransferase [Amycolatopsis xylanica]